MKTNGGSALIKSLEMEGVEVIFGLPGGRHPAGVRPDPRLADPPHPRAPRAGRRPHGRGLRPRHRPPRRRHGHQRARAPPTSSRRCATPTWTPSRWWCITGQVPTAAIGTDAFQECDIVGITRRHHQAQRAGHRGRRTSRWSIREAFHIATTGRPGPVLIDIPKDIVDPRTPDRPWTGTGPSRSTCPATTRTVDGRPRADQGGRRADPRVPSARSSTPAAASSRPGPPRRCASWPS